MEALVLFVEPCKALGVAWELVLEWDSVLNKTLGGVGNGLAISH